MKIFIALAVFLSILLAACSAPAHPHVMANPEIQFVIWGGQDPAPLESDWRALCAGGVFDRLAEYGVRGCTLGQTTNAKPDLVGQTFNDLWVLSEFHSEVTTEPGIAYVVVLPPGSSTVYMQAIHVTGYHWFGTYPYAVVTYDELVISHEIYEMATDPDGREFRWGGQEVGDYCEGQTDTIAGVTVQKVWSAAAQGCQ